MPVRLTDAIGQQFGLRVLGTVASSIANVSSFGIANSGGGQVSKWLAYEPLGPVNAAGKHRTEVKF